MVSTYPGQNKLVGSVSYFDSLRDDEKQLLDCFINQMRQFPTWETADLFSINFDRRNSGQFLVLLYRDFDTKIYRWQSLDDLWEQITLSEYD